MLSYCLQGRLIQTSSKTYGDGPRVPDPGEDLGWRTQGTYLLTYLLTLHFNVQRGTNYYKILALFHSVELNFIDFIDDAQCLEHLLRTE